MRKWIFNGCIISLLFLSSSFGSSIFRVEAKPLGNSADPPATDAIRLKNGSIIYGRVVRYENDTFTIVIPGTQSRAIVNIADVASIEFAERSEEAANVKTAFMKQPASESGTRGDRADDKAGISSKQPAAEPPPTKDDRRPETEDRRLAGLPSSVLGRSDVKSPSNQPPVETASRNGRGDDANIAKAEPLKEKKPEPNLPVFHETAVSVPAQQEWTDSGIDVQKGEVIRFSASGQIKLSRTQTSGPGGVNVADPGKLISNRPTGGLIAVIGDDNDDFIFIGTKAEFAAKRSGRLFLMPNEDNLKDNSGAFNVRIQVQSAGTNQP